MIFLLLSIKVYIVILLKKERGVMEMNKSMKMKVLFLFVIMFFSVLYIKPINGEAYTSKGINKEIKKVIR